MTPDAPPAAAPDRVYAGTLVTPVVTASRRVHRVVLQPATAAWLAVIELLLVIIPLWVYVVGAGERRKQKHYQAWNVIAAAEGRKHSGGRPDALKDLNRDGIRLRGVALAGAFLEDVRLPRADMKFARLDSALLSGADLRQALLTRTSLSGAVFNRAVMLGADLSMTERSDGAQFVDATLCGALFIGARLPGADFSGARLEHARFDGADLRGATFSDSVLPAGASFRNANIAGLRSPAAFRVALEQRFEVYNLADDAAWEAQRMALGTELLALWPAHADTPGERRPRLRKARAACRGPRPAA